VRTEKLVSIQSATKFGSPDRPGLNNYIRLNNLTIAAITDSLDNDRRVVVDGLLGNEQCAQLMELYEVKSDYNNNNNPSEYNNNNWSWALTLNCIRHSYLCCHH